MSHALASASSAAVNSHGNRCALVVSDSGETISNIDNTLSQQGVDLLVVREAKQALSLVNNSNIDFVLIDVDTVDMPGDELAYSMRVRVEERFIPIIIIASSDNEELLSNCLSAGGDDFLYKPFTATSLKARLSSLDQVRELKKLYKSSLNEQLVAKQILAFALSERHIQFEEIKLLSKSKGIFSGDLFLTARHPDGGLHVLLADFTGHGLSAAIGALPVADIFSVMSEKGFEIEDILENLNNKLHTLLPVSMFMACIALKINSELNHIRIWNGGMPDIILRDSGTGLIKQKIISKHIPLGISDSTQSRYVPEVVTSSLNDQLIMYTDGLTDAVNANGEMFGYEQLEHCLHENQSVKSIFPRIVEYFNKYCGGINPDDDVTLACVPCTNKLTEVQDDVLIQQEKSAVISDDEWCWYMELSGTSLLTINPVPLAINEATKIKGCAYNREKLEKVLSALYENAMRHGLLIVASEKSINTGDAVEGAADGDAETYNKRYLRLGLKKVDHEGVSSLLVSVEDSGEGFDYDSVINNTSRLSGTENTDNGIAMVYEVSEALHYHGRGNIVEAIISEQSQVGD